MKPDHALATKIHEISQTHRWAHSVATNPAPSSSNFIISALQLPLAHHICLTEKSKRAKESAEEGSLRRASPHLGVDVNTTDIDNVEYQDLLRIMRKKQNARGSIP